MNNQNTILHSYEDLTTFLSNFPGGLIRYSIKGNAIVDYINDEMLKFLGYATRDAFFECTQGQIEQLIHEDDLKLIVSEVSNNQVNTLEKHDIEHRIITSTKDIKWVLSRYHTVVEQDGTLLLYCVSIDINNMKKMQSELLEERERYGVILSLNSNCFFEYDIIQDSVVFTRNTVFEEYSGKMISNFQNKLRYDNIVHKDDIDACIHFLNCGRNDSIEFRYINKAGETIWCHGQGMVICDDNGNSKSIMGCINNISEQKRETEQLQELAKLDGLTRLFNRMNTETEIMQFLEKEGKYGSHALMIVDIDNFKRVNDQLGHLFGDAVLNNIAYTLKNVFYTSDIVGRVGGDEFVVFLKNIDSSSKLQEKAKEVEYIFCNTYSGEGSDLKISCSMGVSKYPEDGCNFRELFQTADIALYQAKGNGKNCCMLYDSKYRLVMPENNADYYNQYYMDSDNSNDSFGKEITMFAFDILSKTKDVKSAVNLLIEKVGRIYDSSSVLILEELSDSSNLMVSYCWDKVSGFSEKNLDNKDYSILYQTINEFNKDGIFAVADREELSDTSPVKQSFEKLDIKSMLQCAFYDEGNFKGIVCVVDSAKGRFWTKEEVDTLIAITKIISFYLLKYRVSERIQEKLDQIKNYDALTGLSTLHKFKKDANKLRKINPDKKYAIIYSDLSNFKYINDTLGYEQGDQVLCDFAGMLNRYQQECNIVARVSADNFIAMISFEDESQLIDHVVAINERFQMMQKANNINCNIIVTSGACVVQSSKEDIMTYIDNANIARKSVKGSSTTVCKFYDVAMQNKIKKELDITNSMESALENKEFLVYLQPKIDLHNNKLVGAEALVRWQRADGTMLPPDDFIPLFEKNGFILQLDFYIYEEVCKLLNN